MKRTTRLFCIYAILFTVFVLFSGQSSRIQGKDKAALPQKTVALKFLFNFKELKPEVNQAYIIAYVRSIALDDNANVYFCDSDKNRVMTFSLKGDFIKQIGGGAPNKTALSYPAGIDIKDKKIYLVDDRNLRFKSFDPEGNLLNSFTLDEKSFTPIMSIAVGDSRLFLQTANEMKNWNDGKLISVFSMEGKKVNGFGRIMKTNSRRSFPSMNESHLIYRDKKIYGAHMFAPTVFCYDTEGKELLYKKLNLTSIDKDIDDVFEKANERDSNTGDTGRRIRAIYYIWGFSIDDKGNYLLAVNNYGMRKGFVLALDPKGTPIEKIRFTDNGKYVFPLERIIHGPEGRMFVCARNEKRDSCFFEWTK